MAFVSIVMFGLIALLWLVAFAAWIWFLVVAFRESIAWGLVCIFIPCAALVFLIKFWEDAKHPFLVNLGANLLIVLLAAAMPNQRRWIPTSQPTSPTDVADADEEQEAPPTFRRSDPYTPPPRYDDAPTSDDPSPASDRNQLSGDAGVYELVAEADPERRQLGLRIWREQGLDRLAGGRARLIKAMGQRVGEAEAALLADIADEPPGIEEGLRVVSDAATPAPVKRALIEHFGRVDLRGWEVTHVAGALAELSDTDDLLIEEVLARLGRPREAAAARLVATRGLDWARGDAGQELLGGLVRRDPSAAAPLAGADDAAARVLACELLTRAEGEGLGRALEVALPLLRDGEVAVRVAAARCFGRLGDPRASWGIARSLLRERDLTVRAALEQALRALPSKDTFQYLVALRRRPDALDRMAAQWGARALDGPPAVRILLPGLEDEVRQVKVDALKGLLGQAEDAACREAMASAHGTVRQLASDPGDPEVQDLAFRLDRALLGLGR